MLNTPVMFLLPSYTETTTTTTTAKCVLCYNIRSVNICDVDVTYNHFSHLCLWYLLTEVDHLWVSTVRCDIDFFSPLIIFTTQSKENSNWKRKLSFWFSCLHFKLWLRRVSTQSSFRDRCFWLLSRYFLDDLRLVSSSFIPHSQCARICYLAECAAVHL